MTAEKTMVWVLVSSPLAVARRAVRAMRASISPSTRQLTANAAPVSSQIPTVAAAIKRQLGAPSVASNMPITAQNTASLVTRGLVNDQYWAIRLAGFGDLLVAV